MDKVTCQVTHVKNITQSQKFTGIFDFILQVGGLIVFCCLFFCYKREFLAWRLVKRGLKHRKQKYHSMLKNSHL